MKTYKRAWQQVINAELSEIWKFFSQPENIILVTPKNMHIDIVNDISGVEKHEGMTIEYQMTPIPRYRIKWITEITEMKEYEYFMDVQLKGPYRIWQHEHYFKQGKDGVLMTDIIHYALPWGVIGDIINSMFINARLNDIFEYRKKAIDEIFPGSG